MDRTSPQTTASTCYLLSTATDIVIINKLTSTVPPFWYRLTWVVPDKGPLNGCVCVCVSLLQCWGDGVVFCLEQGADCLHMVQLMPLPSQNPSPLASYKSRLFIPSWYWLTQIFLEKRLLNGCSSVLPTSVLTLLAGYESPEITADCNSLIPCAIQTHLLH